MKRPRQLFFAPWALLLTLAVGMPLYGQDNPDKKVPENKGSFKGELKPAVHTCRLESDQIYMIEVKARNFRPLTQVRDKDLQAIFLSSNTAKLTINQGQQEYVQHLTFTPRQTEDCNLVISQSTTSVKGPMEYTVTISPLETILAVQDQLTEDEPFYALRGDCFHKVHTVELQAGDTYQIDLTSNFNPYLVLEDPLGNILGGDANSGEGQNSRLYFQPGTTNTYRLIATSSKATASGPYTLTVTDTPTGLTPTTKKIIGPAIQAPGDKPAKPRQPKKKKNQDGREINIQGELNLPTHSMKLNAGKMYNFVIETKSFRPYLRIYDANGTLRNARSGGVANINMEYTLTFDWAPNTTGIHKIQLMTTGTMISPGAQEYTIEVNPK